MKSKNYSRGWDIKVIVITDQPRSANQIGGIAKYLKTDIINGDVSNLSKMRMAPQNLPEIGPKSNTIYATFWIRLLIPFKQKTRGLIGKHWKVNHCWSVAAAFI